MEENKTIIVVLDREGEMNIPLFLSPIWSKPFKKIPTLKEIPDKNYYRLYSRIQIDPQDIPPGSLILTFGHALYAITKTDYLEHSHFLDNVTNPSYVYSPDYSAWIVPLPPSTVIFSPDGRVQDNVYVKNAQVSIKKALNVLGRTWDAKKPEYEVVTSPSSFFQKFKGERKIAWDLETSGVDPFRDKIGYFSCAFSPDKGYCIPWSKINPAELDEFLKDKFQIGANLKFDVRFVRYTAGMKYAKIDSDVVVLGHALNETRSNSLKSLAWWYSPFGGYDRPMNHFLETTGIKNYLDVPEKILTEYAALDAAVTFAVHERMVKHLEHVDKMFPLDAYQNPINEEWSLSRYYWEVMIPSQNLFVDIELQGIYIDVKKMREKAYLIWEKAKEAEQRVRSVLGDINLDSPKQLRDRLQSLGWPRISETPHGDFSTGVYALNEWEKMGIPGASDFKEYRTYIMGLKTFLGFPSKKKAPKDQNYYLFEEMKPMEWDDPTPDLDGGWGKHLRFHESDKSWRMHPIFSVMLADSGRNRCSSPNLQQIPARGLISNHVRECVTAPENHVILSVDYSSLQLRLATLVSEDPLLMLTYTNPEYGEDVHSTTAHNLFVQNREFPVYYIEEDGKTYGPFFEQEEIVVLRDGQEITIPVTNYRETDKFVRGPQ